MKIKFKKITKYLTIFVFVFLVVGVARAGLIDTTNLDPNGGSDTQMGAFLGTAGFTTSHTLGSVVSAAITGFLGMMGIVLIIMIIMAGFKWMMAEGNNDKVQEAMKSIRQAIIGLLIVVAAYSITYYVFNYMNTIAGSGSGIQQGGNSGGSGAGSGGDYLIPGDQEEPIIPGDQEEPIIPLGL